jgi:hypothetical protein
MPGTTIERVNRISRQLADSVLIPDPPAIAVALRSVAWIATHPCDAASKRWRPSHGRGGIPMALNQTICGLLCLMALALPSSAVAQRVVIENVHVLPMTRNEVLRDQVVEVEAGRIVGLRPMAGYLPDANAERIDGAGGFLLPGLVDTHVHLEEYMDARPAFGDAPVFLRHGITSVFNLRGFPEHLALRSRIASGELLAPTLYTAGEFVNEPRITTPAEAAAEVRAQAEAGYDLLKFREVVDHEVGVLTTTGVDRDTLLAVTAAAREHRLPVMGHAPHGLGLQGMLDARLSLAHVGELVQLHFFPRQPPSGLWLYLGALGVLLLLFVGGLGRRLFVRRAEAGRVWRLALLALLLGVAALGLLLVLLPGGPWFDQRWLLGVFVACLAGLLLLGLRGLLLAVRSRGGAQAGFAVLTLAALPAAGIGLLQGLPLAQRSGPAEMDRVATAMAEAGVSIGTSLVIYDAVMGMRAGAPVRIDPADVEPLAPELHRRYLGAQAFFAGLRWRDLPLIEKLIPRYHDYAAVLTLALHRAGVPLLAGTDAYGFPLVPPGRSMTVELELLAEAGIPAFEVLRSATVEPARFLGREQEFGSVAIGQRADLLLLAGNPLDDIRMLREPRGVMLRGQWLPRAELDAAVQRLRD